MGISARMSSVIQLWLLLHPNFLTNFFLNTVFYNLDLVEYSKVGPKNFLMARSKTMKSKNFAALGRLIVGDFEDVAEIIEEPQKRSTYLGRAKLNPKRMSDTFMLFLSDAEAIAMESKKGMDKETHATLHEHFVKDVVPVAMKRISSNEETFKNYVKEGIENMRKAKAENKPPDVELGRMVVKYIVHAFLGAQSDEMVKTMEALIISTDPKTSLVAPASLPIPDCLIGGRVKNIDFAVEYILNSEFMAKYEPNESNVHQPKETYARLIMEIMGIAGILGTSGLVGNIVSQVPEDLIVNFNNHQEVFKVVLEAGRMKTPVNNVNILLPEKKKFKIHGKERTLPKNTLVAGNLCLASLDPDRFADPHTFDHTRSNLVKDAILFHSNGYEVGGKRGCPGRGIATKLAGDFLTMMRTTA